MAWLTDDNRPRCTTESDAMDACCRSEPNATTDPSMLPLLGRYSNSKVTYLQYYCIPNDQRKKELISYSESGGVIRTSSQLVELTKKFETCRKEAGSQLEPALQRSYLTVLFFSFPLLLSTFEPTWKHHLNPASRP